MVSPEEVRRVAELARLALEPAEVERLAYELSGILEHVDALEEAVRVEAGRPSPGPDDDVPDPTTGAASTPRFEAVAATPLRADEAGTDRLAFDPGELAPEWEDGWFSVPLLPTRR